MSTDGIPYWRTLKRSFSYEEFVEEYEHPFLLRRFPRTITSGDSEPVIDDFKPDNRFSTDVSDASRITTPTTGQLKTGSIVPLVKSQRNPFEGHVSVGRSTNCDIVLRDQSISKVHARFQAVTPAGAQLVDTRSQNGTRVNGRPLDADEALAVTGGDIVIFGSVAVTFLDAGKLYRLL